MEVEIFTTKNNCILFRKGRRTKAGNANRLQVDQKLETNIVITRDCARNSKTRIPLKADVPKIRFNN